MKREKSMTSNWVSRPVLLAFAISVSALGGCVFVVNPEGEDGVDAHWATDYEFGESEYTVGSAAKTENANLARQVGQALEQDDELSQRRIQVTASRSEITLHGEVGSLSEFDRAVTLALGVNGVDEVVSRMTVRVGQGQYVPAPVDVE